MADFFRKIIIPSLVIGYWSLVILSSGCGDLPESTGAASISISPTAATVGINQTKLFSAIAKNSLGQIVSLSPVWSVEGSIGTIATSGIFAAGGTASTGYVVASGNSISAKVAVTVTTTGWLTGLVSDSSGAFPQGIKISILNLSGFSDITDASGRYTISSIPPGRYSAQAEGTTLLQGASTEVTISGGETVTWSPSLQLKTNVPTIPTTTLFSF